MLQWTSATRRRRGQKRYSLRVGIHCRSTSDLSISLAVTLRLLLGKGGTGANDAGTIDAVAAMTLWFSARG